MTTPVQPTADDMARDLAADLERFEQTHRVINQALMAEVALPAAIRRALAAEPKAQFLDTLLAAAVSITDQQLAGPPAVIEALLDWINRAKKAEVALETIWRSLGGQSWPQSPSLVAEAVRTGRDRSEADVRRLQGIIDSLAERVAAQSELLTQRAERKKCGECRDGIVTGEPYDGNSTSAETWPCPACNGRGWRPSREEVPGVQS